MGRDYTITIPSIAFASVMLIVLLAVMIIYAVKRELFLECCAMFKNTKLARNFPLLMFVDRIVFCLMAGLLESQTYSSFVLLGWVLINVTFIAVGSPYATKSDYFRSLGNQSSSLLIVGLYCLLSRMPSAVAYQIVPIVVVAILAANLIGSIVFIALGIKEKVDERRKDREDAAMLTARK